MPKMLLRPGSAPDPAEGAYSAPPDPLAGFKGPTSKGREENGREMGGRGRKKGGKGTSVAPQPPKAGDATADRRRLHSSMAWFTTDWSSLHHTVRFTHKSGDVINFIIVACRISSRLK